MSSVVVIPDSDEEEITVVTDISNSGPNPATQNLQGRILGQSSSQDPSRKHPRDSSQEPQQRPQKRQALKEGPSRPAPLDDVGETVVDLVEDDEEDKARQASHQHASPGPQSQTDRWIAPFLLFRSQGIPNYANRYPTGLRLRDVVTGTMQWVLVSNYMIDMGWLLSACPDLKHAGFVQIVHGESHPTMKKLMKEEAALVGLKEGANLGIHAPPLPIPYGTHHSKAFLIEYETGMRVIVHTANLVHCDNSYKTQGCWVQDFPRKDSQSAETSEFERDLLNYLRSLQILTTQGQMSIVARVKQFDFSSARAHLIASHPGRHAGEVGHRSLRAKLAKHTFPPEFKQAPVFAQFSSLGSLDQKWLHQEFQQSLCAGRCPLVQRSGVEHLGVGPSDARGMKLIWPSVGEVQNSLEGWAAGRSIPGFEKNVKKPFLQPLWHRFGGEPMARQRAMPHIKSYGRYVHLPGEGTKLAWFLLASHNLSKAAWGSLSAGQILMVRSYELGVLFLPALEEAYRQHRHCGFSCTSQKPLHLPPREREAKEVEFWTQIEPWEPKDQTSKMFFPVPYKLPPKQYRILDQDRPWMADFGFPGVDCFGRRRDEDFPPIYGFTEAA